MIIVFIVIIFAAIGVFSVFEYLLSEQFQEDLMYIKRKVKNLYFFLRNVEEKEFVAKVKVTYLNGYTVEYNIPVKVKCLNNVEGVDKQDRLLLHYRYKICKGVFENVSSNYLLHNLKGLEILSYGLKEMEGNDEN